MKNYGGAQLTKRGKRWKKLNSGCTLNERWREHLEGGEGRAVGKTRKDSNGDTANGHRGKKGKCVEKERMEGEGGGKMSPGLKKVKEKKLVMGKN